MLCVDSRVNEEDNCASELPPFLSFVLKPVTKCFQVRALRWLREIRSTLFGGLNAAHLAMCLTISLPVPVSPLTALIKKRQDGNL